jgi:hypothetical protein
LIRQAAPEFQSQPVMAGPSLISLRRALFRLLVLAGTPYRRARDRYLLAKAVRMQGGPFRFWCDGEFAVEANDLVYRLAEALNLIHDVDPHRHARFCKDSPRIFILDQEWASYWIDQNLIVLPVMLVREAEIAEIALDLVHEAAHARIARAGIGWWPDLFERIERRCVKAELGFSRSLQAAGWGADARISWYQDRLSGRIHRRTTLAQYLLYLLLSLPGWALFSVLARAEEEHRRGSNPSTAA